MRFSLTVPCLLIALPLCAATGAATRADGLSRAEDMARPGDAAVVLFFVATDCPISNRTFPEMKRVRETFAGKPVRFWYVYPNQGESAAVVKQHQREFDPAGETILDVDGSLTRMAHAYVTPSVAVLVRRGAAWSPVYSGRVDDRYVRLGLERPKITSHSAERVVEEVLAGRTVDRPQGNPVGCAIMQPGLTR